MLYQIDIKQNYGWWTFLGKKKIEETICIEIQLVKDCFEKWQYLLCIFDMMVIL